jgi:hypothetical protein
MEQKEETTMPTLTVHKLFDVILDRLNKNSFGVTFDGNFTFKFWQQPSGKYQDFHILSVNEEILEFDATRVVPFVDISAVEIPFNERNRRQDYEVEYYLALRIEDKVNIANERIIEFDTNDDKYKALLETYEYFKTNLTHTTDTMRVGFKVREPQKVNIFKYNKHYYQLFALVFNVTKVEFGRFGNEMQLYMRKFGDVDWELLDTTDTTVIMGKTEHERNFTTELDRKISITSRNQELRVTINYTETPIDNLILQETMIAGDSISDNAIPFEFRALQTNSFDISRKVYITAGTVQYINNVPETITFSIKQGV